MRQILVDYARKHIAAKRGANSITLSLDEAVALPRKRDFNLLALDDALDRLAAVDARQSKIVEMRFFGGLSIDETSEVSMSRPANKYEPRNLHQDAERKNSTPTSTRIWRTYGRTSISSVTLKQAMSLESLRRSNLMWRQPCCRPRILRWHTECSNTI